MKFPAYSTEPERAPVVTRQKQRCRLIRIACPDPACGVVLRITRKWLNADKRPVCACGAKMQEDRVEPKTGGTA
jgi:hypothetical protein